jgi:hypothetical protein
MKLEIPALWVIYKALSSPSAALQGTITIASAQLRTNMGIVS